MLLLLWFFVIVLSNADGVFYDYEDYTRTQSRIAGGYYTQIHNVPYQVQIIYKGRQICAATIISEYWLLSAAHCYYFTKTPYFHALTGSTSRGEGEIHQIRKIYLHSGFYRGSSDNDISLILLRRPIKFNRNQMPIRLSRRYPLVGEVITISGYGKEYTKGPNSPVVKLAYVPVIDHATCAIRYYPARITSNMFCAGDGISDTCQGDSGGPATINGQLVGIVSFGRICASPYYPGVYTKIYNYREWIWRLTRVPV